MTIERVQRIEKQLKAALSPEQIQVDDESHLHVGHAGAGAGGHFKVFIVSEAFNGLSLIKRHRLVYNALDDMMPDEIHALSIKSLSPTEFTQ